MRRVRELQSELLLDASLLLLGLVFYLLLTGTRFTVAWKP